jgi:hypothetical protein
MCDNADGAYLHRGLGKVEVQKRRLVSAYLKLTLWGISLFMVCHSTCVSSAGDRCENVFLVLEGFREDLRGPIIPLGCELADRMGCNKLDEVTVCDYSEYLVLLISLSAGFARERYARWCGLRRAPTRVYALQNGLDTHT